MELIPLLNIYFPHQIKEKTLYGALGEQENTLFDIVPLLLFLAAMPIIPAINIQNAKNTPANPIIFRNMLI
ncbi:MAG: hypothetical protein VB118_12905 [Oscillospiraceae bacterium]|nr:hypothetical protein [Oscillospiraceae bacterium]